MLRNLGIRWQILAVLALPLLVTLGGAGFLARQTLVEVQQAQSTERLSSSGAAFTRLVDDLQKERATTAAAAAFDQAAIEALPEVRLATDKDAATVRALLEGAGDAYGDRAGDAIRAALAADSVRKKVRAQFDAGGLEVSTVVDSYNAIVLPDAALPEALAQQLVDRVEAGHLETTSTLLQLIDATSRMQLAGRQLKTGDLFVDQAQAALATARADADRLAATFRRQAGSDQVRLLDAVLAKPAAGTARAAGTVEELADRLASAQDNQAPVELAAWDKATGARLAKLTALSTRVTADAHQRAADTLAAARLRAQIVIGVAAGAVLVSLLLALVLARRITAPLRRLTQAATEVGAELPGAVARLQMAGDSADLELPEVPVSGRGEVGRLAEAFREVNRVTVEVAKEQARLRLGISEMFVNVARRNQTLLSRQLAFIDQLERTEEDPDSLDNLFRLDHLATRMRRNAESLLVLAGMESGRRLRRPILLSDVVRTATSEIEHYERVSVAVERDPLVLPHLGLAAAHLVAELLDNATTFSDPQSTVLVTLTGLPDDGMRITVRDEGIGMSPAEITDALARIAAPTSAELVGSPRLGFHVIGSLARRLEAHVALRPADGPGLLVTVDLPASLFVPDSAVDEPSGWPAAITPRTPEPAPAARPAPQPVAQPVAQPVPAEPMAFEPVAAPVAEAVAPAVVEPVVEPVAQPLPVEPMTAETAEPAGQDVPAAPTVSDRDRTALPPTFPPVFPGPSNAVPVPLAERLQGSTPAADSLPLPTPAAGTPAVAPPAAAPALPRRRPAVEPVAQPEPQPVAQDAPRAEVPDVVAPDVVAPEPVPVADPAPADRAHDVVPEIAPDVAPAVIELDAISPLSWDELLDGPRPAAEVAGPDWLSLVTEKPFPPSDEWASETPDSAQDNGSAVEAPVVDGPEQQPAPQPGAAAAGWTPERELWETPVIDLPARRPADPAEDADADVVAPTGYHDVETVMLPVIEPRPLPGVPAAATPVADPQPEPLPQPQPQPEPLATQSEPPATQPEPRAAQPQPVVASEPISGAPVDVPVEEEPLDWLTWPSELADPLSDPMPELPALDPAPVAAPTVTPVAEPVTSPVVEPVTTPVVAEPMPQPEPVVQQPEPAQPQPQLQPEPRPEPQPTAPPSAEELPEEARPRLAGLLGRGRDQDATPELPPAPLLPPVPLWQDATPEHTAAASVPEPHHAPAPVPVRSWSAPVEPAPLTDVMPAVAAPAPDGDFFATPARTPQLDRSMTVVPAGRKGSLRTALLRNKKAKKVETGPAPEPFLPPEQDDAGARRPWGRSRRAERAAEAGAAAGTATVPTAGSVPPGPVTTGTATAGAPMPEAPGGASAGVPRPRAAAPDQGVAGSLAPVATPRPAAPGQMPGPMPAAPTATPAPETPVTPAGTAPSPAPSAPAAPAPDPVAASLADQPAAPWSMPPAAGSADDARRSVLASQALTELSQLSYRPAAVDAAPPSALQRRTPAAAPAEPVADPVPGPDGEPRERRAADVRSLLSGFKAGVERGRTSPSTHRPVTGPPPAGPAS